MITRRDSLRAAGLLAVAALGRDGAAAAQDLAVESARVWPAARAAAPPLPPLAVIALNRTAFGPRPGSFDFNTFNAMPGGTPGDKLASFVDWQLDPQSIDDSACDARIAAANLVTLNKPLTQLWADHYESSSGGRTQPVEDVTDAAFIRAVYSRRQLLEVLVDFWHNHFNVYAWDYAYASATWAHYDRDVIRAHALGNFRQMLEAVATSPAMLYYLDNYINQRAGPNENYARELFELHTLGAENYLGVRDPTTVPGYGAGQPEGYVDNDVYEATRCFTGWRVNDGQWPLPTSTGQFLYYDSWHDRFQKIVLGLPALPADQAPLKDGRDVLDKLASHPGTGRFVSRKLCRRFIGDNPPQAVVDAAAAEFTAQKDAPDQLKRVLRVVLLSDAFKNTWGEKIKRPFEAAVSILRAINAEFAPSNDFDWNYENMGQPLFERRPPDGYLDVKEAWTNTSSMLKRWQLCLSLIEGWIDNTAVDVNSQMPAGINTANAIVDYWVDRLLGRPLSSAGQRSRIVDFMRGPYSADFALSSPFIADRLPRMVSLLMMAPDFQYR
jgi:uncharacterized protein (DUF1800 family)